MIKLDREELAWAAGFFDGEGSTQIIWREGTPCLNIAIHQISTVVLERFQGAVLGRGKIFGPYKTKYKQQWIWQIARFEEVQAIICLLWSWLSPVKKSQALKCLKEFRDYKESAQIVNQIFKFNQKKEESINAPVNA